MEVDEDVVMAVTQIDTPDRLYLQLDEQESSTPCAKYRNQLLQELENLSFKLQEDAPEYPKLKVVRPGQVFFLILFFKLYVSEQLWVALSDFQHEKDNWIQI